jgi:hypothetical protein
MPIRVNNKGIDLRVVVGHDGDNDVYWVFDDGGAPVASIHDADDGYTYALSPTGLRFRRFDSSGAKSVSEIVSRGLDVLYE